MNASDIMTHKVISIGPDASVSKIVSLMLTLNIGGLPVVKDGAVVGIVSDGDLLRRAETGTEPRRSRWLEFLTDASMLAAEYTRSHGRKATHLMTRNVVSVTADTPISEVATVLETRRIKRVPVLRDGKHVGIISRSNLLRALASRVQPPAIDRSDDRQIQDALVANLGRQAWVASHINPLFENGVVHLWGWVPSEAERKAAVVVAENIAGVASAVNHLGHGTLIFV